MSKIMEELMRNMKCWLEDFWNWKQYKKGFGGGLSSVACFTASSSLGVWVFQCVPAFLFCLSFVFLLPLSVLVFYITSVKKKHNTFWAGGREREKHITNCRIN